MVRENHFYIFLSITLLTLLGTFGCSETETRVDIPEIEVKVIGKLESKGAYVDLILSPYLLISVTNVGSTEPDIVYVDVYAQKNGDIVDTALVRVDFLRPGETAVEKATFFNIDSHSDYDSIELNARVFNF